MEKHNFIKYYRVYKNDTTVTEVSTNDFIPLTTRHYKAGLCNYTDLNVTLRETNIHTLANKN